MQRADYAGFSPRICGSLRYPHSGCERLPPRLTDALECVTFGFPAATALVATSRKPRGRERGSGVSRVASSRPS